MAVLDKRDTEALSATLGHSPVAGYGAAKALWNAQSGRSTSVSSSKSRSARQRAAGSVSKKTNLVVYG